MARTFKRDAKGRFAGGGGGGAASKKRKHSPIRKGSGASQGNLGKIAAIERLQRKTYFTKSEERSEELNRLARDVKSDLRKRTASSETAPAAKKALGWTRQAAVKSASRAKTKTAANNSMNKRKRAKAQAARDIQRVL